MLLFFLVPFGFVLKISLSQTAIAQPPYLPVFDATQGWAAIKAAAAQLSLDNFRLLVSDDLYILSYLRSLVVAAVSTSILLGIGYPIAYGMARLPKAWQGRGDDARHRPVLDFVFDPHLCLDQHPAARTACSTKSCSRCIWCQCRWCGSPPTARCIWASSYSYLPFMILPLYAVLAKLDPALRRRPAISARRLRLRSGW